MTSNMAITKIKSMTENYPEFLAVNLNYAGATILVDKIESCKCDLLIQVTA
jgi:hypothetical protein